jgi:hypothetical protein
LNDTVEIVTEKDHWRMWACKCHLPFRELTPWQCGSKGEKHPGFPLLPPSGSPGSALLATVRRQRISQSIDAYPTGKPLTISMDGGAEPDVGMGCKGTYQLKKFFAQMSGSQNLRWRSVN